MGRLPRRPPTATPSTELLTTMRMHYPGNSHGCTQNGRVLLPIMLENVFRKVSHSFSFGVASSPISYINDKQSISWLAGCFMGRVWSNAHRCTRSRRFRRWRPSCRPVGPTRAC